MKSISLARRRVIISCDSIGALSPRALCQVGTVTRPPRAPFTPYQTSSFHICSRLPADFLSGRSRRQVPRISFRMQEQQASASSSSSATRLPIHTPMSFDPPPTVRRLPQPPFKPIKYKDGQRVALSTEESAQVEHFAKSLKLEDYKHDFEVRLRFRALKVKARDIALWQRDPVLAP